MTDIEKRVENSTEDIKLYSLSAISIATFLGGPLAAGYLIGENFRSLDKPNERRKSISIGVITTILLLGTLFTLPEEIMDQIPNWFFPIIYTGIIWVIVERKQGRILKAHKENNHSFYSRWKAAGIGFISGLLFLIAIFGLVFLSEYNKDYDPVILEKYDAELAIFTRNESETLVFYDYLQTGSSQFVLRELDIWIIPKWEENIEIIHKTDAIEGLPSELKNYNKKLLKYAELRVQAFKLFEKSIKEESDEYSEQIDRVHMEIEKALEGLK